MEVYLDMEHELFGERYTEYEKLIDGIEEYIHNGFKEKEEYTKLKDYYLNIVIMITVNVRMNIS